jgi:Histidine kinase-, DNA gyrase B-, and HSP90-like ATPase
MKDVESESVVTKVGQVVDYVDVTIGPRFLELFSEHMYSSPNKAFEELVSNSWDAGADTVYIGLPENLSDQAANIWVLDNGESMDVNGFRALWEVARSSKRIVQSANGRPPIGKFGVGKLATYILANELTYICKADDGIIRAITMNYQRIHGESEVSELHISPIKLDVRVLSLEELRGLLSDLGASDQIYTLIEQGVPKPVDTNGWEDEFGGIISSVLAKSDTWTLALMTKLKQDARNIQVGRTRWLLRSTLPFGSSMYIVFNREILTSSKSDIEVISEWVLGEGLGFTSIILSNDESRQITENSYPYPHICIEGIEGKITGRVKLYKDKISGGKSDMYGGSNGFFININGRVINQNDQYFGLENLNHASWAKFRATIRADGMDKHLEVNREGLLHGPDLDFFRGFLRMLFNKARSAYNASQTAAWPGAGEVLIDKWGLVPLEPLQKVVIDGLTSNSGVPGFIDISNVEDSETTLKEWKKTSTSRPGDFIKDVTMEQLPQESSFVKYDLGNRNIVVNSNHPFSREHSESSEEQTLLRDIALVDLLTEAYMYNGPRKLDREIR